MPEKQENSEFDSQKTHGVKMLLGDPRKAVIKLSIPMIIAMSVQTIYNLADAFWVALLGANELAATGFVFPLFFMVMALSTGVGMGATSALSRRIGSRDKKGADNVGIHAIILGLAISVFITIPLFFLAQQIFSAMGAGDVVGPLSVSYGRIIALGFPFMFFANICNAILRGEGDTKRAMYAMVVGSVLNIVLDPIFIFGFDMGISGAALATSLSIGVTCLPIIYWLAIKKDTFVSLRWSDFKFNKEILKDILRVGVPASVSQLSMSIMMVVMNYIIVLVGSTDGVAIYSTGWRVASMALMPTMGIAAAVISIGGATFGEKAYAKTNIVHLYATKLAVFWELAISVFVFVFAAQIAAVFTQSADSARLFEDLTLFLRIMSLSYAFIPFGMLSGAMFQAIGRGGPALVVTLLRTIILAPIFAFLFAFVLGDGLVGIWWGIVFGNAIGPSLGFSWIRKYLNDLRFGRVEPMGWGQKR